MAGELYNHCIVCEAPGVQQCSSCKTARYCSKEHQKQDWRAHKEYCLQVKAAGDQTFTAILFPVNERRPRLVKIPFEDVIDEEDGISWQKLQRNVWFKHPDSFVKADYFNNMGINGPDLGRTLCFFYDDNSIINRLPLNRCIVNMTGGKAGHVWCGNIFGLRSKDHTYFNEYNDAVLEEDLEPFVAYFDQYNKVRPDHMDPVLWAKMHPGA
ncbi:Programmed cell death protein 2 [Psilocybe cubensis]|uniref:Programmed cell death protein 2 n=1 Tax=Psilocybe cubensis TaxID=181762 RepID=A0ACB8GX00_PSICU|nr:Programmed cell death protein 2 [Psilocybe cubensis]KAH9480156.1 Programmed cell death protein 2 [Psilocybe cubensis]